MARDEVWRLSYHPAWDLNNCWHLYFPSWNYHEVFFLFLFFDCLLVESEIRPDEEWRWKSPEPELARDQTMTKHAVIKQICALQSQAILGCISTTANSLLVHISSFRKMMPNQTSYPGSSASSLCLFLKSHSEWSNLMQSAHIVFLLFNIQPEEGFWEIWKIANHILSF